jgi:hypothetical protein
MIRRSKVKGQRLKVEIKSQKRLIKIFVFWFVFLPFTFYLLPLDCYAQAISSTELIQNAKEYDGREVIFEGEVIGEVMKRKDGIWVNVNDGENSIGVWMPTELANIIEHQGSYKVRGDILQVKGKFNQACPMHGGDLDIHAMAVQKIRSGWQMQERIIPAKRSLLFVLAVVLCLVLILRVLIVR